MDPLTIFMLLCFVWICQALAKSREKRPFEFMNRKWSGTNPVSAAITKGYNAITNATDKPFFVQYWAKDYLVLPRKYLPDIRRAHREQLDFADSISDLFFMYNWIGDLFKSDRMVFAVIKGINPQLPRLSEALFEESQYALDQEFGELDEPKEFGTLDVMTKISLRVMTRIIAGTELSRDEKFLDATHAYFGGNFFTGLVMLQLPFPNAIRDIIGWPLWKYHQVFTQGKVLKTIKPVIAKRMDDYEHGRVGKDELDAVACTLRLLEHRPLEKRGKYTPLHTLSHETLQLVWAAGQSPAMSITGALYKMLECPEYVEPMREEAQRAVSKHGWSDGIFNELPMIDSFIRETHRMNPAFSLNATRSVKGEPFTFSDGFTVPVGTRIAFPAEALQRDPNIMKNPNSFEGFRFVELAKADTRQEDGVNRWHASHCSYSNLTFGYGNHACPGRFIAIRLLKMMLCRLLLQYEFGWDFKGPGDEPARFVIEGASLPNITQKIRVRRRT